MEETEHKMFHNTYDLIFMKYSEQLSAQKQKAGGWLPGGDGVGGGDVEWLLLGKAFSFGVVTVF